MKRMFKDDPIKSVLKRHVKEVSKIESARFVRETRKKSGLNTAKFGEKIGKSGRTVEGWEQGRHVPSQTVIMLIKNVFRWE